MFKNFKLRHHGSTVEVTVAQQLHQSERKVLYISALPAGRFSFLIFWYFFIKKKVQKKPKNK